MTRKVIAEAGCHGHGGPARPCTSRLERANRACRCSCRRPARRRHSRGPSLTRQARGLTGAELRAEAELLLAQVRLPRTLADRYPAELSGGERQRVAIARALAAGPELLVCDEITSALDVSVQAAVMELIADLRRALGIGVLLISHDLGVVASVADRLVVLRGGGVREQGPVRRLLESAQDEYTRQLALAAPTLAPAGRVPGPSPGSARPADGAQGPRGERAGSELLS